MPLTVRINGSWVDHSGLTCSNIRRGGFEACNFQAPVVKMIPRKGDDITVWDGLSVVWQGFVDEVGVYHDNGTRGVNVSAVGYGAKLKDNPMSMIFIDRDLSRWTVPSAVRRVAVSSYIPNNAPEMTTSPTTAEPLLRFFIDGPITTQAQCEGMYDAGVGNEIGSVIFTTSTALVGSSGWLTQMFSSVNGETSLTAVSSDTDAAASSIAEYAVTDGHRFLHYIFRFVGATATDTNRWWYLKNLAVVGDHGLTVRGDTLVTAGYRCVDIIDYVLTQTGLDFSVTIEPNSTYISHLVYYSPVEPEQIVDEMAKYLGWHYGTWESGCVSDKPSFEVYAPPTDVTCSVNYNDCGSVDINDKLTQLHNRIIATGNDAAGTELISTVDIVHKGIQDGSTRTLSVNVGLVSSQSELDAQAAFLLALDQDNTRAAGSVGVLPPLLDDARPSHLLRAGKDRITIRGLPGVGKVLGDYSTRSDSFQISRVSISEAADGSVQTNIEVDTGADLTETLTARLTQADAIAQV